MQIVTNASQKELKAHGAYAFPLLVSHECLSGYESGAFLWHWHPEIELTLIEQGEMLYKVNRDTFHLRQGQALFGNANALHAGSMVRGGDCHYLSVTFDPKLVYGFSGSSIEQKYVEPVTQNLALGAVAFSGEAAWQREIIENIRAIARLDEGRPPLYEFAVTAALQAIWQALFAHLPAAPPTLPRDKAANDRIKAMLLYIEQNYAGRITLEQIAGQVHLCPGECSRLFKRCMNVSLFSFLQTYRVERSLELLADPALSVTEAAENVGFADSNYFAKVFVKLKGCSPRAYRKTLVDTSSKHPKKRENL